MNDIKAGDIEHMEESDQIYVMCGKGNDGKSYAIELVLTKLNSYDLTCKIFNFSQYN